MPMCDERGSFCGCEAHFQSLTTSEKGREEKNIGNSRRGRWKKWLRRGGEETKQDITSSKRGEGRH